MKHGRSATRAIILTAAMPEPDIQTALSNGAWGVVLKNTAPEVVPGTALTYRVTVRNAGPSNVSGVTLTDPFPAALAGIGWSCAAAGGATCGAAAGSGDLSQTVGWSILTGWAANTRMCSPAGETLSTKAVRGCSLDVPAI